MAQKNPEMLKDPPVASSSEEEESGSEESESSGDEDEAVKPTQTNVPAPSAATKKVAESESESESESEISTSKRPLKQTETEDVSNKKMKTNEEEGKKQMLFQRLFSETDEITLLQGILDFTSTRTWEIDGFCDYIKDLIDFNANRSQLVTKIQRLKKKFTNTVKNAVKKGNSEQQIVFSKDVDEKIFDLSRKIWGNNGALVRNVSEKKEETEKSLPLATANVASFFKQENGTSVGLDESAIIAGWDMVPDGPKKREMEAKLKKLKAMQASLTVKRAGIVHDCAKLIFKDM